MSGPLTISNTNPFPMIAYKSYEGTLSSGDVEFDVRGDLGRHGTDGRITIDDGSGDVQVQILCDSENSNPRGKVYGDVITLKENEELDLEGLKVEKIKLTFVSAACTYRIPIK